MNLTHLNPLPVLRWSKMRSPLLHPKFEYKQYRPSTTQAQARRNQKKNRVSSERQSRGYAKQLKRSNPKMGTGTLTLKGRVILTVDKQLDLNFDPRPAPLHLLTPCPRLPPESSTKKTTHRKSTNFFRRRRHLRRWVSHASRAHRVAPSLIVIAWLP